MLRSMQRERVSPYPEEPSSSRARKHRDATVTSLDRRESNEFSDSFKARQKYRDVADAAQDAFESAAYAAAAARAAVELSRSNTPHGPDDSRSLSPRKGDLESKKANSEPENPEFGSRARARSFSSSSSGPQEGELRINVSDEVDELPSEPVDETISHLSSGKQIPLRFQAGLNVEADNSPFRLNLANKPISVRTRRLQGY